MKSLQYHSRTFSPSYGWTHPRCSVLSHLCPRLLLFDRLNRRRPTKILTNEVKMTEKTFFYLSLASQLSTIIYLCSWSFVIFCRQGSYPWWAHTIWKSAIIEGVVVVRWPVEVLSRRQTQHQHKHMTRWSDTLWQHHIPAQWLSSAPRSPDLRGSS